MAEVLVKEKVVKAPAEPLFSKKNRKLMSNPLDSDNPITVQILGICSALAVTVQLKPTLVMALAVLFVVAMSNFVISSIRNIIPSRIRIIVQLGIVASLVAVVDQLLQAYAFGVSKQLSVFVGLIITNCIVMGRLEAFAMANKPWPSLLDGIGNSLGYGMIILAVAFFRELLGSGSIFGFEVFKAMGLDYTTNGLFVTPAGACIVLGLIVWAQRARNGYTES